MKSKIFNTDQVRSIQDGRMTQFMKVVKPQPTADWMQNTKQFSPTGAMFDSKGKQLFWLSDPDAKGKKDSEIYCPFGKVGDVIYCREKWNFIYGIIDTQWEEIGYYHSTDGDINKKWKSPATMPREAAQLFLHITNIRVMRVQELNDSDMVKQQARLVSPPIIRTFKDTSVSNLKLWQQNPYCWIIDFEKTDKK